MRRRRVKVYVADIRKGDYIARRESSPMERVMVEPYEVRRGVWYLHTHLRGVDTSGDYPATRMMWMEIE